MKTNPSECITSLRHAQLVTAFTIQNGKKWKVDMNALQMVVFEMKKRLTKQSRNKRKQEASDV